MSENNAMSERTRIRREPQRAVYDRREIYQILDEGFVCHVGFTADAQTYVIPTMYARVEDAIYFHGSAASRMLRAAASDLAVCVTVTLADGLVLARGNAAIVNEEEEKLAALRAFTEKILPGRWNEARQPNQKELKATSILRLPLDEVSAKVRTGGVEDEAEDYALEVWAGIVPLRLVAGEPVRDERCAARIPAPEYAKRFLSRGPNGATPA